MSRDSHFLDECVALCRALRDYSTLAELRSSTQWPELRPRLDRVLGTIRRHAPRLPPVEAPDPSRVMAVHWNIEHGNRFEQVSAALRDHPQLQAADLVLLNEVDLGMARAGNRDVAADLGRMLYFNAAWAPLFLETTRGRDDDPGLAAKQENQEALFGLAILSRWPIGETRIVEMPGPEARQYDVDGMYGRYIALVAAIERPEGPFTAVATHLEVHRTRGDRMRQMKALMAGLPRDGRPVILAGDFNSSTLDRGRWWDMLAGGVTLALTPKAALEERLMNPDRGGAREPLFDALRDARFEWVQLNDRRPTLRLRLERIPEARGIIQLPLLGPVVERAQERANLRLDWFAGRDWRRGRGATVMGLDGPGKASDHAPIVAEFR